jgi:CHAT domain-containing protein
VGDPERPDEPSSPVARAELERIATRFRGDDDVLLYGTAATKDRFLEAAPGATHVHLSCHGDFRPWAPLTSSLALAGRDELTLADVLARMPFGDARLVVASACHTATADVLTTPDEGTGLAAGFLQSGTPGVLATLWSVDALSTALLMERFYRYHLEADEATGGSALPPAGALRRAQRWMASVSPEEVGRCLAGHIAYADAARTLWPGRPDDEVAARLARLFRRPYFWAGFVHAGV